MDLDSNRKLWITGTPSFLYQLNWDLPLLPLRPTPKFPSFWISNNSPLFPKTPTVKKKNTFYFFLSQPPQVWGHCFFLLLSKLKFSPSAEIFRLCSQISCIYTILALSMLCCNFLFTSLSPVPCITFGK